MSEEVRPPDESAAPPASGPSLEQITFPSASGRPMRAALARPADTGPLPAVIVIHEAFGLNRDIREKAARLAAMGYVALAPDLYDKPSPKLLCIMRTMRQMRAGGGGEALDDLEAARSWLNEQPFVEASKVGVIGFCMGGGFALLYASRAPLNAAAVFYGRVPTDSSVLDDVCPVVASYGAEDRSMRSAPGRLETELEKRGIEHDIKVYEGAGHSYMSDHRGFIAKVNSWGPMKLGFHPEAAQDSWRRVEAFFGKHLD